jgi:release factor glutamine methyltransferase
MTVSESLTKSTSLLTSAGVDTPRLDAQLLLAWVLKAQRVDLAREPERTLTSREQIIFDKAVDLRSLRRPLAYITGSAWFYGREFKINRAVLIPRPETEILVEEALKRINSVSFPFIADICTGSGCIGISLACERPDACLWLTDLCPLALNVSHKNSVRYNVENRVTRVLGNLLKPLLTAGNQFDVIVSNPPYVRPDEVPWLQAEVRDYEPRMALVGESDSVGIDGMELHRSLIADARYLLKAEGWLLMEVGRGQSEIVAIYATELGYTDVEVVEDLSGIGRVVIARWPNGPLQVSVEQQ